MKNVTVITPSRIHLALIDLNGNLGRSDGGIGLSLSDPGFRITASYADKTEIIGSDESVDRAKQVLGILRERFSFGNIALDIEESIPPHVGLGSGTQLSMGITQAISKLFSISLCCRTRWHFWNWCCSLFSRWFHCRWWSQIF